jgi:2-hydroxychromene-2-carboxylate isomerase
VSRSVDYYFAPQSPWTYLGHQRFCDIARASGVTVRVLPIDLGGKVFPISGGLPVGKRAPQRQAYRLVELKRYSRVSGHAPLNVQAALFPGRWRRPAARLITAVAQLDGTEAAHEASPGPILAAVLVRRSATSTTRSHAERAAGAEHRSARRAAGRRSRAAEAAHARYDANTQASSSTPACSAPPAT